MTRHKQQQATGTSIHCEASTLRIRHWLAFCLILAVWAMAASAQAASSAQEAEALFNRGNAAMNAGEFSKALADFGNLERRFGKSKDQVVRGFVAGGLANRGWIEREQGNLQAALKSWQRAYQHFRENPSNLARDAISYALAQTGSEKKKQGDMDGALAAFLASAELVHSDDSARMRDRLSGVLVEVADILRDQDKKMDAFLAYEKLYRLFKSDQSPLNRARAAYALWQKGRLSKKMGDIDEAMEDWRRVVQEFGDFGKNSFPQTKNFVAWALVDQGRVLAGDLPDMNFDHLTEEDIFPEINQQKEASSDNSEDMFGNLSLGYSIGLRDGQTEVKGAPQENFAEALKLFDEALSRFQSGDVQGISSPLSQAMLLKGQIYKKQGDLARALEAFTVLTQRFLHDADSEAQNNVAGAFVNQGSVLAAQGNFQQALQAFDAAITQAKELQDDFASRSTPLIANLGKAYLFLKDGKNQAALAIFDVVIQDQKEDIDELSFVSAFAWQGKAWALERMGKFPETMACYDDAFARFGAQKAIKVQKANTIMDFMGKWAIVQAKAGALVRHGDKAAALKAKEDFSDYAKKIYDAEAKLAGGSSMFPAMAMVTYLSALPGAVDDKILSAQQALEAVDWEIRRWQLRDDPAWLPMPLQTKAQIQDKDTDKTAVLETLDEIIKTFQDSADVNAQNVFGWALARKAVILRDRGDKAAAILLCEEILRRFEHAPPANMTGMVDNVKRILKEMR